MPQAVTRDDLWHEAIVQELKSIKELLVELLELLKTQRTNDNANAI